MIISKKCLNCGHVAQQDINVAACPACSAIYNKVEAALTPSSPASYPRPATAKPATENFLATLRAESNYPTFRNIVNTGFWLTQVMAFFALTGAVVALLKGSWPAFFGGLVTAIVLHILGRVAKEASHMIADLSDATVRMAETTRSN